MTTEPTPAHGPSETPTEPTPAPSTAITETPAAPTPAPPPTAPAPVKPSADWNLRIDYVLLVLLLVLSFFVASFTAANSDLWTHLATGKLISEGKFEFGIDPFSWATEATEGKPATPWIHQSWLFSLIVYKIHESSLGGPGLVILKAILFTLAIALLSSIGWNASNRWFLLICLIMAVLAASSRLFVQPIVVSLFFIAVTMFIMDRAGLFLQPNAESSPSLPPWKGGPRESWLWYLVPLFALWANLDAWFVLGPIMVGLAWAATGLAHQFGAPLKVPGKTVGMVFGASLLACLVNPFHVRVFQLPPELAYLVITVTDTLHIPMPEELAAGGRTLKELRKAEADVGWTLSALVPEYWGQTRLGKNLAGLSLYPLVLLGLIGFILAAPRKMSKEAPTFHMARFLLWLVFGVLALALYRMIPFFVLIAAPITAMTLGEFLVWQQKNAEVPGEKRDRGLRLARFVTVPFLLLLLYFAWLGWLHGAGEFNSPRRVAWEIRANPSLQKAAETVQAQKASGEGMNVFNAEIDLGNLLPWFAPDVKHHLDSRFTLFADDVATFVKTRDAINGEKTEERWQARFEAHQVNQVAMMGFLGQEKDMMRMMHWWLTPEEWRQRYADKRVVVLTWAGANRRWPLESARDDLNRAAFGEVPESQRPPLHGTPPPQPQGGLAPYLEGVGPQSVGPSENELRRIRFLLNGQIAQEMNARGCRLTALGASLAGQQAIPGGALSLEPAIAGLICSWMFSAPGQIGPAAIPVLMVRTSRQAVAENPRDVNAQTSLADSIEFLRKNQEDRWIGYVHQTGTLDKKVREQLPPWHVIFLESLLKRPHPSPLRDRLRQLQHLSSCFNAMQLQPDNFGLHQTMAKLYLEQNMLDMALEHMQITESILEKRRATIPGEQAKNFEMGIKGFHDEVDNLEKTVKQRLSKWKELPTKTPFQSAYLAYNGKFQSLIGANEISTPFGLGKKAFEMLGTIKDDQLADNERLDFVIMLYDLLLSMGRADVVAERLLDANVKKNLPPAIYSQYQLLAAGALGDYATMDQALTTMESAVREVVKVDQGRAALAAATFATLAGMQAGYPNLTQAAAAFFGPPQLLANTVVINYEGRRGELLNIMTLHGAILLEAGENQKARSVFQQTVTESKDALFFADRVIARRYLELLDEQAQKR